MATTAIDASIDIIMLVTFPLLFIYRFRKFFFIG